MRVHEFDPRHTQRGRNVILNCSFFGGWVVVGDVSNIIITSNIAVDHK